MDDPAETLMDVVAKLEELSTSLTVQEAYEQLDQPTLQAFWREWPHATSWGGGLWHLLSQDLAEPAAPPTAEGHHEVGGQG